MILLILLCFCCLFSSTSGRKPEIDHFKPIYNVEQGDSFPLLCVSLKGSKPITFEWFRDGHRLMSSSNIGLAVENKPTTSSLSFENILVEYSGNYSCRATNSDGVDESFTIVEVKGQSFCGLFQPFLSF